MLIFNRLSVSASPALSHLLQEHSCVCGRAIDERPDLSCNSPAITLVDFQLSQCKKKSVCHAKKLFGLKDHPTLPQGLLSLIIWPLLKPTTFVFLLIFVIVFSYY